MYIKLFRRVIRITLTALIVVVLCVAGVFATTSLDRMNRSMSNTTEAYGRQIASGMETVLGQSVYQTYRYILNDNGITDILDKARQSRSELLSLSSTLNTVLVSDQFYESVYLYSKKDEFVLEVTESTKSCRAIGDMPDEEMASVLMRGMAAILKPRKVTRSSAPNIIQRVIMPVAVPLGLNASSRASDCMLVTNIDVGRVFKTLISETDIAGNAGVYITDESGLILVAADYSLVGRHLSELDYDRYPTSILASIWSGRPVCYQAVNPVGRYGWRVNMFMLEENALGRSLNLSSTLLALLIIGAVAFAIVYSQLRRSMKPVSDLAQKSIRQDIKECILQTGTAVQPAFPLTCHGYMLMLIRHAQQGASRVTALLENDGVWRRNTEKHIIPVNKGLTVLALAIEDESDRSAWQGWAVRIQPLLEEAAGAPVYIVAGSARGADFPLAEAYHEALLLNEYTMSLNGRRVVSPLDVPNITSELKDYPVELEKQMLNVLFAGNVEQFDSLLGQFAAQLFDQKVRLTNQEILQQLERWQNAVLACAARIPVRLPGDICAAFDENDTQASVLQKLGAFAHTTAQYVRRHEEDHKANLGAEVQAFIDEHLADSEFTFTSVSDRFGLNRSQLTALLKEQLGMGFADYVSEQRIERSKRLLRDPALTVNDIAQKVGFTYPHYFIRVFKKREGVTPGQYREKLAELENNIIYLSQNH